MSDTTTPVGRRLTHCRNYKCAGYRRDDGLWDLEIEMIDTKPQDFPMTRQVLLAGQPMHHMAIRITIDSSYGIQDVLVNSLSSPYPGTCDTISKAYKGLLGLNLMKGFRKEVTARFRGVQGCTHITEMLFLAPTLAIQSLVEERWPMRHTTQDRPPEINGCHALAETGEIIREVYPRWWIASTQHAHTTKETHHETQSPQR
jgi:Protein of unknown function (DUF2889)